MQETFQAPACNEDKIFVARQPIFDIHQRPCAFELLFRDSGTARKARMIDPDLATLQMIAEGFFIGRANGDSKPVFINFTEKMLHEGHAEALPAGKCVIELLEDIPPTDKNVQIVKRLKEKGYGVALDDFTGSKETVPWLNHVNIVKVDILSLGANQNKLKKLALLMGRFQCRLLAEKVESIEAFKLVRTLGYQLFQGFFFCKPEIVEGKKISSGEITKLKLLKELGKEDFEVKKISELLHTDTSLSYRLFRYINSAGMGFRTPITSLDRAVTLLGQKVLVQWLRVLMLCDLARSKKAEEVVFTSVQRGRFLELMAKKGKTQDEPETMFLLGMFSLLDVMLGSPMERVVEQISLDDELKAALTGHKNRYMLWIEIVKAYEKQEWMILRNIVGKLGLELKDLDQCYTESLKWTNKMIGQ